MNVKGAFTPEDIDERCEKARKKSTREAKEAEKESERRRLRKKAKAIEILQERGFAEATIREANLNKYGIVNLTLHYGPKKAKEMKLAFERARLRRGLRR